MVHDQLLCVCPPEVRQFILERKPASAAEAATLADTFVASRVPEARRTVTPRWGEGQAEAATPRRKGPDPLTCYVCQRPGHRSSHCPERRSASPEPGAPAWGPRQAQQASEPQPGATPSVLFARVQGNHHQADNEQRVTVNGQTVTGFRDTGADVTLVHSRLVPKESIIPDQSFALTDVRGALVHLAQARVKLDWGVGVQEERIVCVSSELPVPVVLGTDLGRMGSFYESATTTSEPRDGDGLSTHTKVLCTLGKAKGGGGVTVPSLRVPRFLAPEAKVPVFDVETVVPANHVTENVTVIDACMSNVIDDKCIANTVNVLAVTQSAAKVVGSVQDEVALDLSSRTDPRKGSSQPLTSGVMGSLAEADSAAFTAALQNDPSLEALRQQAAEPLAGENVFRVYWEGERLYSELVQPALGKRQRNTRWLVVPSAYRNRVLESAHGGTPAMHSGVRKTLAGIRKRFYWPGMNRDAAKFCKTCAVCQERGAARDPRGVPLRSPPPSAKPALWVAVDNPNPLPVAGNPDQHHIQPQWRKRTARKGPSAVELSQPQQHLTLGNRLPPRHRRGGPRFRRSRPGMARTPAVPRQTQLPGLPEGTGQPGPVGTAELRGLAPLTSNHGTLLFRHRECLSPQTFTKGGGVTNDLPEIEMRRAFSINGL